MKRGERQMWRKLRDSVDALIESDDYAKEYIARRTVEEIVDDLKLRNGANARIFNNLLTVHEYAKLDRA